MSSLPKLTTLCYLFREKEVLLAMKKRGFGIGKWNGAGGKVKLGESIEGAAGRECEEEVGARPQKLLPQGVIQFHYADGVSTTRCSLFAAVEWQGEIIESDEMRPQWFLLTKIPYDEMWETDRLWFPQFLAGQKTFLKLFFDEDFRFIRSEKLEQ